LCDELQRNRVNVVAKYNMYFSPTGGTKKVADYLAAGLNGGYTNIDLCADVLPAAFEAEDVCLVSVPSYGGRVPAVAVERIKRFSGNGAKAILVCVYGNREWEDTLTELQDALEDCGFICVAAVAAVAEHSIFRQFAAGRPDSDDAAQLAEFAGIIQQKLDSGADNTPKLAGSHGTYKEFGGTPFKPVGNDSCGSCGLCAAACPVGAINPANPRETDVGKCISCMRCVTICPNHARDFDAAFLAERAAAMEAVLSGHKENYLYL